MMQDNLDALDVLTILSFYIGYRNLIENEQQSAYNDVNAANDRQANQLLDYIGKRLDIQDKLLLELKDKVGKLTDDSSRNIHKDK